MKTTRYITHYTTLLLGSLSVACSKHIKNYMEEPVTARRQNIEAVFPNVFKSGSDIYVDSTPIYAIPGYTILPFADEGRNHYDNRQKGFNINYLIQHYTVIDFNRTLRLFTAPLKDSRVSSHYVITQKEVADKLLQLLESTLPPLQFKALKASLTKEQWAHLDNEPFNLIVNGGEVVQVVPEDKSARHAGISYWEDDNQLNNTSIGIEHVNQGHDGNEQSDIIHKWYAFDKKQMEVSGEISKGIIKKYAIKPYHVLGHADIAPHRKQDPGVYFPWEELYNHYKVGAWLDEQEKYQNEGKRNITERYGADHTLPDEIDPKFFLEKLKEYGYNIRDEKGNIIEIDHFNVYDSSQWAKVLPIVKAFRAHFSANKNPDAYNNQALTQEDIYWVWALTEKYKR